MLNHDIPVLLTTEQAAGRLGLVAGTLANWRLAGVGPPWHRVGSRAVRYAEHELLAWATGRDEKKGGRNA